ncbi:putative nuclear distribution protein pac-1a protein [Phaeoacremonium minimum UCRPA7]|uniref:Putative nuclear distribution protein pac-1a protein n=1 Tax=Phaeoacremonium minimum (strain UCR-PA7) TaxID=1286976 RepID=R8B8Z3_PHAM7|nr:putative nuclear distribution protein pac-1a protein [Phaeoacremonium minimum UCRPA7]EON95752.1 putative nuclear distribution protein pac-1a protein [Phaeoacremonium minimum UCRPA7]
MLITAGSTVDRMSQILTSRQAEELHKSIIAYLASNNLPKTAQALREELSIGDTFDAATSKKYEGLLEKKWTSVVRLQKKVDTPTLQK